MLLHVPPGTATHPDCSLSWPRRCRWWRLGRCLWRDPPRSGRDGTGTRRGRKSESEVTVRENQPLNSNAFSYNRCNMPTKIRLPALSVAWAATALFALVEAWLWWMYNFKWFDRESIG